MISSGELLTVVVSFYSYVGYADLRQNIDKLAAHGVKVEYVFLFLCNSQQLLTRFRFHPVFLGGINNLSGMTALHRFLLFLQNSRKQTSVDAPSQGQIPRRR